MEELAGLEPALLLHLRDEVLPAQRVVHHEACFAISVVGGWWLCYFVLCFVVIVDVLGRDCLTASDTLAS